MQLKLILLISFLTCSAFAGGKLDLSVGGYSLEAETSKAKGSDSGIGAYHINYSFEVYEQIELSLGYTVLMSETFTGDLGYGVDAFIHSFHSPLPLKS